ncbi:hypothetical protein EDB92DRAFT_2102582 [Lactarius akahatsu]|uniref:DUF6534 domain-containing protein n=1 Tax=Lactarius akahatsu TaxID=416441 RepID=A0AAD4LPR2_9AGAM|nr:hypothetical protein EDB92DRAFT_2102582 [Lactarius akahatsu]
MPVVDIRNSCGAAFVGLLVSTILFGLTIAQTWFYFWNYRHRDSKLLKFFVAFLTVIDTLHTITCAYVIYWYLILNFGNVESLRDSIWAMDLQAIFNVIIGSSVQLYYARRVYVVSRSIILLILIVVVIAVGSGTAVYLIAEQLALKRFSAVHSFVWPSYITVGAVALSDGLVATSMCWSLYRRRTGFAETDSIILTLMAYSINTGLLTSLIGITAVVCFVALPTTLVWLALSFVLSKCYVNSLLAMLNSRNYVRDRSDSDSGNPDNTYHLTSIRFGQLSEAAVSVHRSTTLDYGRNKSDHHDEATFEVPKPDATIVPLESQAQTSGSSA